MFCDKYTWNVLVTVSDWCHSHLLQQTSYILAIKHTTHSAIICLVSFSNAVGIAAVPRSAVFVCIVR